MYELAIELIVGDLFCNYKETSAGWVNHPDISWDKLPEIPDHIVKSISEASNLIGDGIK